MAINFTSGLFQGLDNDGDFVPYGLVYFTDPDTGDAIQTYADSDMTIPNTHPVVLSPSGKAYIIVPDATTADIRFDDANSVTIWFLEDYDVTDQTAIDNLSAILVSSEDKVLDSASYAVQPEDEPVQEYTGGVGEDVVPETFSSLHYAAKSESFVALAEAQVALAAEQVVLAEEQVALATTEADRAEVAADEAAAQVVLAEAQVALAKTQALLSANSANESALSATASAASANISYADFQVTDGDLIVGYYDPLISVPSIVDGDFIITY